MATFTLAPGFRKFEAYEATAGLSDATDENPIIADETHIIKTEPQKQTPYCKPANPWKERHAVKHPSPNKQNNTPLQHMHIPIVETSEDKLAKDTSLLLHYHRRFGHISFTRLRWMAKLGIIPSRLRNCDIPLCSACMYAKATRKPWRGKPTGEKDPTQARSPGEWVSVDQLVSPTPGLIAQMTGKLTSKRYKYATIFVDQASKLGYVYLQKTATVEETLEAKQSFQQYSLDK